MTEDEWLACESPQMMNAHLSEQRGASARKFLLFGCSCGQRVVRWFLNERLHAAVGVLEKYAEGAATTEELATMCADVNQFDEGHALLSKGRDDVRQDFLDAMHHASRAVAQAALIAPGSERETISFYRLHNTIMHTVDAAGFGAIVDDSQNGRSLPAQAAERKHLASVLRCVTGNPFRPPAFDSRWRTGTALSLARQMYESRDFSAMPILADALQDAGCDNTDILNHCRDASAPHVRGCWAVDLVLEKS